MILDTHTHTHKIIITTNIDIQQSSSTPEPPQQCQNCTKCYPDFDPSPPHNSPCTSHLEWDSHTQCAV